MHGKGRSRAVMQVFVHLAYGFDAVEYERKWAAGRKGMNDRQPYGYSRAASDTTTIVYSRDRPEGRVRKYIRLFIRLVFGFDLVHAWRNRTGIMAADVVWTHTESQHLAIALIFLLTGKTRGRSRPKMIGQSIWLFDNWKRYTAPRRWFFKLLLRESDVLTVHSPENLQLLRSIVPEVRSELVLYGVKADPEDFAAPAPRETPHPVHVLSVGNDRDRDWGMLVKALRDQSHITVTIASRFAQAAAKGCANIRVCTTTTKAEILALYDWADIVVVPLQPNLHVSGITVIEEAAIRGVPVISTDVGGLRAYFDGDAIAYVPAGDPGAIRQAIETLTANHEQRYKMASRAQARMGPHGLSSDAFVRRHVELSRELLHNAPIFGQNAG
jgi:glycosyltransferase involved in cell wall biosynthesis